MDRRGDDCVAFNNFGSEKTHNVESLLTKGKRKWTDRVPQRETYDGRTEKNRPIRHSQYWHK